MISVICIELDVIKNEKKMQGGSVREEEKSDAIL
jgi:hypothetical protein